MPIPSEPIASTSSSSVLPVAVLGGGLAGLTAAYRLKAQGVPVVGYEATSRLGGLIQTEQWEDSVYEHGPDGFLLRKGSVSSLCQELGVVLQELNPLPERIYLAGNRGIFPLPQGMGLLLPTRWGPFWTSPLLSLTGKFRLWAERFVPARQAASDETLANFVTRRFGKEALTSLAEPLLGGVWNTDPQQLSMEAAFPHYVQLEKSSGSVLRGIRRGGRSGEGGGLASPVLGSEELVRKLVQNTPGVWQTGQRAVSLTRTSGGWQVNFGPSQPPVLVRAVILAVPPQVASRLVAEAFPEAARLLKSESHGIGTVSLTLNTKDFVRPLDAWGTLFSRTSDIAVDGQQWSSVKWNHRTGAHRTVVRAFFGGFRHPDFLQADDETVLAETLRSFSPWLRSGAQPLHVSFRRWQQAFPQVTVGHTQRIASTEKLLGTQIVLAGQGYRGVGMPAVVESAERAVRLISAES
ncbi:MAG: protoporphyrinogen oxidase [Spirochaetales bacterium]|nr:protoporphyrinogen oxidase [Spirochaetales bacterium]